MELPQESSKVGALSATTSRNLSSSSSAFVSACQSPFLSPRSPTFLRSESTKSDTHHPSNCSLLIADLLNSNIATKKPKALSDVRCASANALPAPLNTSSDKSNLNDYIYSSLAICNGNSSTYSHGNIISYSGQREKQKKSTRSHEKFSFSQSPATYTSSRLRNYDVYIGFHGRKPSMLRFTNWLRAELEVNGVSCFAADRSRCRNSRSHDIVERAMNASSFGVVILTKRSFGNPYSIEELRNFLSKKNLVPIFFDVGPGDCLARDIIERRGELWEKHRGELLIAYGGAEKEWKEAVDGLSRIDEGKLDARDGQLRDCILKAVVLLATRLGRRSVVERINKWKERVEKEEFPFPRNEFFVGRKKGAI